MMVEKQMLLAALSRLESKVSVNVKNQDVEGRACRVPTK